MSLLSVLASGAIGKVIAQPVFWASWGPDLPSLREQSCPCCSLTLCSLSPHHFVFQYDSNTKSQSFLD